MDNLFFSFLSIFLKVLIVSKKSSILQSFYKIRVFSLGKYLLNFCRTCRGEIELYFNFGPISVQYCTQTQWHCVVRTTGYPQVCKQKDPVSELSTSYPQASFVAFMLKRPFFAYRMLTYSMCIYPVPKKPVSSTPVSTSKSSIFWPKIELFRPKN